MITGANSGIGKATARKLASKGCYIVMVCRNEQKAIRARDQIIQETGHRGVEVILADLSTQYDIREAARQFRSKFNQLDILINNAGILPSKRITTVDGVEKTFAVNHLAPFLLTNLLMDPLHAAPSARVINVASEVHRLGARSYEPHNLQLKDGFRPIKAYGVTKLYNIMFTHELAKHTRNSSISAYSLHPGAVDSNLSGGASWTMKAMFLLAKPFLISPEKGAQTPVWLAHTSDPGGKSGSYFKNRTKARPASIATNDEHTERLWSISERLSNLS